MTGYVVLALIAGLALGFCAGHYVAWRHWERKTSEPPPEKFH